jgi:hypothetical protein
MADFSPGDRVVAHDDLDDLPNLYGTVVTVGQDGSLGQVRWDGGREDELVNLDELIAAPTGDG